MPMAQINNIMGLLEKIFGSYSEKELARIEPIQQRVLMLEEEYKALSDYELKAKTKEFKERIAEGETLDSIMPEALATCREAADRVLGKRAYPVQILGAIVLHQGRIAEMKTGEGKTLVACLASYVNALSGKGVHVVTVNDYLAKFQSEEMGKVYRFLGLSIGCILHGLTNDERREAYNCDITYGTNNEFGFDYLRDNMVIYKKNMVQREPNFAIVDEVDSILIDEARTPLIISGRGDKATDLYGKVDVFVRTLSAKTLVEMDEKVNQDEIDYVAQVQSFENGKLTVYQKNVFSKGDEVDLITFDEDNRSEILHSFRITGITDDKGNEMRSVTKNLAKANVECNLETLEFKKGYQYFLRHKERCDYIVDEKAKTATITQQGVKKAERYFGVDNLMAAENLTLLHHINQSLKAHGIMHIDIDYVVKDGEVVIVDEFTGRLMLGRRFNDGLHQAIEAKEGVEVAHESKTLATITFQNYFRLYPKLSGMTGTAMTEEDEFKEIYKLDVIAVPTNRPVARIDHPDVVYRTEKGKFNAVIDQIIECNKKGQPVLVGTISIEKSELLSKMLSRKGIKHEVLNAKQHAKEAEIVAQAGKLGAVTIATNMAGRGTDIILGGNAEFLAKAKLRKMEIPEEVINEAVGYADTDNEEIIEARKVYRELYDKYSAEVKEKAVAVREAGGLYILGTERHESRRIDNQLRGRSGRQGDEGESKFFLSTEDDLMRIFAGDRLEKVMKTFAGEDEDMPIESKMLSKIIASAQKRVEGKNFSIRKNVLNYDDVMSTQREIIYSQRAKVLSGEDIHDYIITMIKDLISGTVGSYLLDNANKEEWNFVGLRNHFFGLFTYVDDFEYSDAELESVTKESIIEELIQRALAKYEQREKELSFIDFREFERVVLLKVVDQKWMNHIDDMDELKKGIGLRSYGQHNPVVEYRYEGMDMFDAMIDSIREETVRNLFLAQIKRKEEVQREQVLKPTEPNAGSSDGSLAPQKAKRKPAPNDLCPCGSGKKYKKCCGMQD